MKIIGEESRSLNVDIHAGFGRCTLCRVVAVGGNRGGGDRANEPLTEGKDVEVGLDVGDSKKADGGVGINSNPLSLRSIWKPRIQLGMLPVESMYLTLADPFTC